MIARSFPLARVRAVLTSTGKASVRERDLPAHVMVYYAIALALYMHCSYKDLLRCLLEGLQWLADPAQGDSGGRSLRDIASAHAAGRRAAAPIA